MAYPTTETTHSQRLELAMSGLLALNIVLILSGFPESSSLSLELEVVTSST